MEKKKRIYQIDLLRFIAALSVVLYHFIFFTYKVDGLEGGFDGISDYFKYGYLGVDLFFIISGFVIVLSIGHNSVTRFLISRITRLYPTYWLSVLLTFLVVIFFGAPAFNAEWGDFFLNLTMFQNYFDIPNMDGVYWTLFVEMKFYLFIIVIYLLLNKVKKINLDYVIYFWTGLTALYLVFSSFPMMSILNELFILKWSSYFIAGMVFHQVYKGKLTLKYGAILILLCMISIVRAIKRADILEVNFDATFSPIVIGSIIFSFYAVMFLIAMHKLQAINTKRWVSLGMLTYPLYLLHQKIGRVIAFNFNDSVDKYVLLLLMVGAMLLVAYVLSRFYEPFVSKKLKLGLERVFLKKKQPSSID